MRNSGPKARTVIVPNREARRAAGRVGPRQGHGGRLRFMRSMDPHWVRSNAIERQAIRDWLKAEQRYNRNVLAWLDAEIAHGWLIVEQLTGSMMTRPM